MRTLPLNLAAFFTASVLVIAVSLAMMQAGVFGDDDDGAIVSNPTHTPAVLQATATPVATPLTETSD